MNEPPDPTRPLDQISTHWTALAKPDEFTLRYAQAISAYLRQAVANDLPLIGQTCY